MIVGNIPWQKAQGSEIAMRKKQFFYRFAEGQIDLKQLGVNVSPLYLNLLKALIHQDPKKRMTWSEFFNYPVVMNEPTVYQVLIT